MTERRYDLIAESLEEWFEKEQRPLPWRDTYDPYHVWVAEVMAQQTRMEVVVRYWEGFIARFPKLEELAASSEESVLAAWSGLGYYRRARMLREGAIEVVERFGGVIPDKPSDLESIRGIGPYTAGAIASIAFDRAVPIVDGNVLRVFSRLALIEDQLGSRALERRCRDLSRRIVEMATSPRKLNQALMELGAMICKPKVPNCPVCPVKQHCAASEAGTEADYPRKQQRKEIVDLVIPVYLVSDSSGRIMLTRAAEGSLLQKMFLLPGEDTGIGAVGVASRGMKRLRRLGEVRHTITHRRVRFEVWDATIDSVADSEDGNIRWVRPGELSAVPHPSWVRKAIELGAENAK